MPSPTEIWDWIRRRQTVVPSHAEIRAPRLLDQAIGADPIIPQRHYFAVVVDEIFLSESRKWHREFDPMVFAITEFVYDGKFVTLPFVIGPRLLGKNATVVPQGMIYQRTRVAGIHPFRGGRVISTVVLCQVRRVDYAKRLLSLVESVATSVPFAGDLRTYTRFSDSVLDGVDALFGVGETDPLVGIRQEFDHDLGSPIRPAYFVLIDGPESSFPPDRFWVRDGGLWIGNKRDEIQPFREASYVLFSTRGAYRIHGHRYSSTARDRTGSCRSCGKFG